MQTTMIKEMPTPSVNGFVENRPQEAELFPQDQYNLDLIANANPTSWQNPTPQPVYNLVVIGGGSAGLVAASGAAGLGAKVALIERDFMGGDCLNVGCVPSKSLIRPAKVIGEINKGSEMGVHVPDGTTVDFGAIMERMRRIRSDISHHDSFQRFKDMGIDVFQGEGKFSSDSTIDVVATDGGTQTLNFKKALLATGTRPRPLPIQGLEETGYLTNETLFRRVTEQPKRLAVIGAGPIGAELAQSFHRFGTEVTVLEFAPRMLGREDAQAGEVLKKAFAEENLRVILNAKTKLVRTDGNDKVLEFDVDDQHHEIRVDEILVAAGRMPNIEKLNLEVAGVEYHNNGVAVEETMQTTNPNVFAAGDIAFKYQFTHTADATARIVLQNALFPGPKKKVSALVIPWCTYTSPEVAHVGMYEHEAEDLGIAVETLIQPINEIDRGRADGDKHGFVKIHIKKGTDKILGATIVADHAGEMIGEVTLAMTAEIGLGKIANTIHAYPTQSEAIKKIADAYNRTRLTPFVKRLFTWWLAWSRR